MRKTRWQTSDEDLNDLWHRVAECAKNDYHFREMDGRLVAIGPEWLRDHVHEMNAYKYFFDDMKSGLEFFLRHQLPDGQFPDFFVPSATSIRSSCIRTSSLRTRRRTEFSSAYRSRQDWNT